MSWAIGPDALARRRPRAAVPALRVPRRAVRVVLAFAAAAFVALGLLGVVRYVDAYWVYRGFPPPRTPAGVPAGRLTSGRFFSRALGRRVTYDVYLPPGYARAAAAGRRFPVLYLLHSPAGIPNGIFTAGAVAQRADVLTHERRMRPMIIVDPLANTARFGDDTEWANAAAGRYESFVLDVVHAIDRRYATYADRQHRGIGGLSMGGYGAANLTLHHPGVFSVVESWSGYFVQTPTGPFAGASGRTLAYDSPVDEVARVAGRIRRLGLRAWLYQGTHDDVPVSGTAAFADRLRAAGADVRYAVYPGGHDWRLWRAQIPRQLIAASRWFAQAPRGGRR